MPGVPDIEQADKVRAIIGKLFMRFIGCVLFVHWAFAYILYRQRTDDNKHFLQCRFFFCLNQHAAQFGIDRQACQFLSDLGNVLLVVYGM